MGNPKGFIEIKRKDGGYRPVHDRIEDYGEVEQTLNTEDRQAQASRCMDCGIPFCHWACPTHSKMPEWQDAAYKGNWKLASDILQSTNSFPEFTGRVCPAPCEKACVLAVHNEAVTIRENEAAVMEQAYERGHVVPKPPQTRTGKKVAVVGSGPSGLSVADILNKLGHTVDVIEQDDAAGGLLRYGIPDFKLNKSVVNRRVEIFEAEGINFKLNTKAGVDISNEDLLNNYDAVCLAIGAMQPRDLPIDGRELDGVHFAMDFLKQQNKIIRGEKYSDEELLTARGKKILVIGGGDTGSDCVGTSIRQKANSIMQIEIMPKPAEERGDNNPWPYWPNTLRSSSSHEEGCERRWSLSSKRFIGKNGKVTGVELVEVEWTKSEDGRMQLNEKAGTEHIVEVDLVLLAMGFTQPIHEGLLDGMSLDYDNRGNISTREAGLTNHNKVFATGDCATGASLVVRALNHGRRTAMEINNFLMS
ncbi:MAG: glutamate synthase subunit beta [Bacteroidales bacterium]